MVDAVGGGGKILRALCTSAENRKDEVLGHRAEGRDAAGHVTRGLQRCHV